WVELRRARRTRPIARRLRVAQISFDRVARAAKLPRDLPNSHAPPGHDSDLHCLLLGKHPRRPKGRHHRPGGVSFTSTKWVSITPALTCINCRIDRRLFS